MLPASETQLRIEPLASGKHRISIEPSNGAFVERRSCTTAYPRPLIEAIFAAKGLSICDEIMREEDPAYVERSIRQEILGYVAAEQFAGKRVLDFGCGAGASTMVLRRLLPPCKIVGVELQERLLTIARLRNAYLAGSEIVFLRSPSPQSLPQNLGEFDFVVFSALFEHLLPAERPALLQLVWRHMKPGAILFLNQTPHRYSPIEAHTTFLPLINYLPDALAQRMARLSQRVPRDATWEELLRAGIRGATVREILGILRSCGTPALLAPRPEIGDRIDLWYSKLSRRHAWLKRGIWGSLKVLRALTGIELTPELGLAIRKDR